MAIYNSDKVSLPYSAESVFAKLSNPGNLKNLLENVPEERIPDDKKDLLESIVITSDSITVPGGPVGNLTFRVTEKKEPTLVKLEAENSPVPLALSLHIDPVGADKCEASVKIDIALPAMLKPMVSGPLQKMVDQFGDVLKAIPFA